MVTTLVVQIEGCASLAADEWRVRGDSGRVYLVLRRRNGTLACTCPGYAHHGYCKHVRNPQHYGLCQWTAQHEPAEHPGVCPRCGGPTTTLRARL